MGVPERALVDAGQVDDRWGARLGQLRRRRLEEPGRQLIARLLGVIDLLDQPLQVGRCFLGHGASPPHGLGVEAGTVAERGEPLVADPAHLEPHVRDLVQLLGVREDAAVLLLADATAPQHVGFGPHLFEPSDDPRVATPSRALLRRAQLSVDLGELGLGRLGLLLGEPSDRQLLLEGREERSGLGELGGLVARLDPRREPEVARLDRRGPPQLVDVRRGQRGARRAGVVDPHVRSALLMGDDHPATEDVEVRELGTGHGPDRGALQRLGQALPLGGVEAAEHGHPVVEADSEHLPAAGDH